MILLCAPQLTLLLAFSMYGSVLSLSGVSFLVQSQHGISSGKRWPQK